MVYWFVVLIKANQAYNGENNVHFLQYARSSDLRAVKRVCFAFIKCILTYVQDACDLNCDLNYLTYVL